MTAYTPPPGSVVIFDGLDRNAVPVPEVGEVVDLGDHGRYRVTVVLPLGVDERGVGRVRVYGRRVRSS